MWQMFFSLLSEPKACARLTLHSRHRTEIMSAPSEDFFFFFLHKHSHIYSTTLYINKKDKYVSDSSAAAYLAQLTYLYVV